jgi:hypothetical protein
MTAARFCSSASREGVTAVPDDATAFSHRDANYLFHPISVWEDAAAGEPVIAANRAFADAIRPFSTGDPLPELHPGGRSSPRRLRRSEVRAARGARGQLRPENLFRGNQNIKPSRAIGEPALA